MILKTQRVGNKRPGGPTRGHPPRASLVEVKGRVPGDLGRPWTPHPKTNGRKTRHRSSAGKLGPRALPLPLLGSALPARGVRRATRKKPLKTLAQFRAERVRGTSSARVTDFSSPGDRRRGARLQVWEASAVAGGAGRAAESAVSTSSREGWSPKSSPCVNPGQEARRPICVPPCVAQRTPALWSHFKEPEATLACPGLPKAPSGSHLS